MHARAPDRCAAIRRDPVEDVAGPAAISREHFRDLVFDTRGRRKQDRWIEITLERDPVPDALPGHSEVRRPVEADDVAAGSRDRPAKRFPFVNTMTGTRTPSRSRVRRDTISAI